jgi:hypothetical protein
MFELFSGYKVKLFCAISQNKMFGRSESSSVLMHVVVALVTSAAPVALASHPVTMMDLLRLRHHAAMMGGLTTNQHQAGPSFGYGFGPSMGMFRSSAAIPSSLGPLGLAAAGGAVLGGTQPLLSSAVDGLNYQKWATRHAAFNMVSAAYQAAAAAAGFGVADALLPFNVHGVSGSRVWSFSSS